MKITAVIPCYNEEESIGSVIQSMPKEVDEILIIDNNSTDKSAEIAQKLGARVVKQTKKGYGWAHQKGFESATGDIIVTLDADGQYPAHDIPKLVKYLIDHQLDFINCTRFPLTNKASLSFTRRFGNHFLTFFTNLIFGIKTKDSQSGMWVFRKKILSKIHPKSGDMPLSEEIKIRAALHPEVKYTEVPISYETRTGESKLFPMKHGFINLWFLVTLGLEEKKLSPFGKSWVYSMIS